MEQGVTRFVQELWNGGSTREVPAFTLLIFSNGTAIEASDNETRNISIPVSATYERSIACGGVRAIYGTER
jgi:hypothetical protein